MPPPHIRPIAICVFHRDGRILVNKSGDDVKQQCYFRPVGGGIEFCEPAADALKREVREELGQEVKNLRLLGALENIFHHRGQPGHEIVFVYDGQFEDESLYGLASIPGQESDGAAFQAVWCGHEDFTDPTPLHPNGLLALLRSQGMLTP